MNILLLLHYQTQKSTKVDKRYAQNDLPSFFSNFLFLCLYEFFMYGDDITVHPTVVTASNMQTAATCMLYDKR